MVILILQAALRILQLIDQVLLGEIVDQALQVLGVVGQRVVIVKTIDLQVVQFDVLVHINALRVHLGHVLDGDGDAEVVPLGVLELAADALDLEIGRAHV